MLYLDLAELPELLDGHALWSARHPALAWFRRADHFGDPDVPLDVAVRDRIAAETGVRPEGPVRVLTHLRYFGHCFNPVTFHYAHDAEGRLAGAIAAVTNTPWGERHEYVLPASEPGREIRGSAEKRFHVSPFMAMDQSYEWRLAPPGERLVVQIAGERGGERVFDATLALRRRELSAPALRRVLLRYPAATAVLLARIYGQALRLKLKGARVHPHPREASA
jgi:DUF1365 family protein